MISTRKLSVNSYEARLMLKFGVEYELLPVDFTAEEPKANLQANNRRSDSNRTSRQTLKLAEPN